MIPQCDPKAGYLAHKQEIDAAIARVLDSGWYILGREVNSFECEFAAWLGAKYAVGVANGTDAIELALKIAGIKAGDQVATVSRTAVATVSAIRCCGAEPRFVDVDEYFTMNPESLSEVLRLSPGVKVVVVVHLYGQMADMPAILDVARKHDLAVIEDCAQAHGASLHGKKAGTWGDFGSFSFYPTKNLGAFGDGGMVVTNDEGAVERLHALRQYGWDEQRCSQFDGVNSRLDELQAAVLRVRLKMLDADNAARRRVALCYKSGLEQCDGVMLPAERAGGNHVYHQFVIRCQKRALLRDALNQAEVGYAIHYPKATHQQAAYANPTFSPVPLDNTEEVVSDIMSLPMFPELRQRDAERVIEIIKSTVQV